MKSPPLPPGRILYTRLNIENIVLRYWHFVNRPRVPGEACQLIPPASDIVQKPGNILQIRGIGMVVGHRGGGARGQLTPSEPGASLMLYLFFLTFVVFFLSFYNVSLDLFLISIKSVVPTRSLPLAEILWPPLVGSIKDQAKKNVNGFRSDLFLHQS